MFEKITKILDVTDEVTSGEGVLTNTGSEKGQVLGTGARFYLNCTGITGTSMAVDIVATVGGVDYIIGSFTDVASISSEMIELTNVPVMLKVVYTETAVTDWDCVVYCSRF